MLSDIEVRDITLGRLLLSTGIMYLCTIITSSRCQFFQVCYKTQYHVDFASLCDCCIKHPQSQVRFDFSCSPAVFYPRHSSQANNFYLASLSSAYHFQSELSCSPACHRIVLPS